MAKLTEAAIAWAAKRKISVRSLEAFGVASGTMAFGAERAEVLCYPYARGSDVVNVKYRRIPNKGFQQKTGGELRFWNLDDVLAGDMSEVFIFEGEMDALAAYEAGIPKHKILSVPNGAPEKASDDAAETDRYRYVAKGFEEGLSRARRFVLVTDGDGPGRALRQDLANILGAARCYFIEFIGTKDANDFLAKATPGELLDVLEGEAKEWPVDGIYRMSELPEPPPLETWNPGFPEWESKLLYGAGTLCALVGSPGHGKSLLGMQLLFNVALRHRIKIAVASFETSAKPHHRRNLRQFMIGKPQSEMTDAEITMADRWIEEHFIWIQHPQMRPSFRWIMDMAEVAIVRHRARIIQIDPWNKLEWERPGDARETDWIRDRLNEAMQFAKDFRAMVQIIAHPSKSAEGRTRSRRIELEDTAGSKHWDNIVDQGLSVFRPKVFENGQRKTEATLFHLKARFEDLGHECALKLNFDLKTRRYESVDYGTEEEAAA